MIKNLSLDTNADIFFLQKYRLCVDLAVEVIKDLILFRHINLTKPIYCCPVNKPHEGV